MVLSSFKLLCICNVKYVRAWSLLVWCTYWMKPRDTVIFPPSYTFYERVFSQNVTIHFWTKCQNVWIFFIYFVKYLDNGIYHVKKTCMYVVLIMLMMYKLIPCSHSILHTAVNSISNATYCWCKIIFDVTDESNAYKKLNFLPFQVKPISFMWFWCLVS